MQTGTTPLIQAIKCNYVQIAGTILTYSADVNKADNVTNELTKISHAFVIACVEI